LALENYCTLQDLAEWVQGGLEASCELNMILDADKAVEKPKNSQFNYFELGTSIMVNTKKIERGSSFTPTYSKFVRVESGLSKYYEAAGSRQQKKVPVLSEQNLNRKKILPKQSVTVFISLFICLKFLPEYEKDLTKHLWWWSKY